MSTPHRGAASEVRYFDDYEVGATTALASFGISREEILDFGRRYDPQPFHIDEQAAAAGPFGGLIASGWQTCALTMRSIVAGFLSAESGMGSPGLDEVRFRAPVRPGDVLTPTATVLEARPSASKPDRGLLRAQIEVRNQHDAVVLSLIALILVRRAPGAA